MPRPLIVKAEVETCTGHRLMDYKGLCGNLHGHNYKWIAEVAATVESPKFGMAIDFSLLKGYLKRMTDIFDHAMVLRDDDPWCTDFQEAPERLVLLNVNPTAENLAQLVADSLSNVFPFAEWVNVELWETSKCRVSARGNAESRFVEITFCNTEKTENVE